MSYWLNTLQALLFGFFTFVTLWVFGKINSADALKILMNVIKDDKNCGKNLEDKVGEEESLMFMMTVICTLSLVGLFINIAGMSKGDAFTGTGIGMHLFWLIYSILVVSFNVSILTNSIFNKISDSLSKTFLSIMTGVCGIILLYNAYKMIREFTGQKTKNINRLRRQQNVRLELAVVAIIKIKFTKFKFFIL